MRASKSVGHQRHAGVAPHAVPVVVQSAGRSRMSMSTSRAAEPRVKRTGRTGSSSRSPIEWTRSPLVRSAGCQHRATQRETGRAENKNDGDPEPRARAGAEGRTGEALDSHRYACARAAEAGAVSAFRTASSSVEATNRTLWTYRPTPLSATVPAEREALICSPTKARSWQSTV